MQGSRIALRTVVIASALLVAGCSANLSLSNVTKPELRKPDWASFSGGRNDFELRPISAADLVGPEGHCDHGVEQGFADPNSAGSSPQVAGGIALQMTECDVVRRAGPVEKIDFGVNDRGERTVVLTYTSGTLPGIYRFAGGRLVSIERSPTPPPAPPKSQKAAPKKPAGT